MYSVRMRATGDNRHISGAERLVEEEDIETAAQSLIRRALSHERGKPDSINISVEAIKSPVKYLVSLPVTLFHVGNADAGKRAAKRLLTYLGIPGLCIEKAFSLLEDGESMRGAILMDMQGERLEPDKQRGIRASRMDITKHASDELAYSLATKRMSSCYDHISEALVLATKVASVKGSVAELCWSDDPFYTAGYVASKKLGYVRFSQLKHEGDSGGRVFFVDDMNLPDYIDEMEKTAVLIDRFKGLREITDLDDITGE
ncbi:6-carboxyhexanoate-CoA ligase [Candidatus Methanoperedens nitroreducens]|uniref:6-carboxyhexanoate--CoA ligase n=1 Tax=Candidatus Methanoperedens nitratireducens TaxID=1392998 RepID=A0A062UXY8_9EURY|nr:6-carboxyhexanoate--CoA ligase [Candidatus Methanoperedens nitroreducens]KCZ71831.1 6-carboxyhexanoate-CoA ligase [Candidatus Methanoperedens nitroreducens]MDJ1422195.1 6-carboxyhexanoate--CoA ligase [Candidatus Methanoperedens sp.]